MKLNILVTGGAGLIGSHLCEELVSKGNRVIAFDNLYSSSIGNIKGLLANKKNFEFIKGDVRNKKALAQIIPRVDQVFHLAAILGVSKIMEDPPLTASVNVLGTQNICDLALKYGKKVTFTSSSDVYGKNADLPLKEDSSLVFGASVNPRWNYGLTKALGEHLLFAHAKKGLSFAIVRLFNAYGPRGINTSYSHVIPRFIAHALKGESLPVLENGKQSRSFCYVSDTASGIILASQKITNDIVNLGSPKETYIIDLARKIIKETNSKSKIEFITNTRFYGKNFEDTKRRVPDITKAKKLLKFKPKVSLEEGIKKTAKWVGDYI